ncbi:MAG: MBL fold metallo-hydrolase [Rhodobacteraceae bacterium]|nr:MBL fold metallo-hydrolase [Paracoccaceae bacterium]
MKITWCGHSAFLFESGDGLVRLLFDPYIPGSWNGALNYGAIREQCDAIFVSHKHDGHFGFNAISGNPAFIRGYGRFWVQNVHVNGVKTWHDESQGAERGDNTAFSFGLDGIDVAHMGDIGHALTDEQLAELGRVDVLLVPVGGGSTVDAKGAYRIVEQLQPKVVIPMHYKTDRIAADLDGVQAFTKLFEQVENLSDTAELTTNNLPDTTTLMVLEPKY